MPSQQRLSILDAAERRFADYGYNKTTMAEIAADCNMSVGNLYRHFPNKSAIAACSVTRNLQQKLECGLQAAAQETHVTRQLTAFLLARLHFSHQHFMHHRHLHECVTIISSEHGQILADAETRIIAAMTAILQQGMDTQQIRQGNAERIAYLIHQSMMRYSYPISLKHNDIKTLEADLTETLTLFFKGLSFSKG